MNRKLRVLMSFSLLVSGFPALAVKFEQEYEREATPAILERASAAIDENKDKFKRLYALKAYLEGEREVLVNLVGDYNNTENRLSSLRDRLVKMQKEVSCSIYQGKEGDDKLFPCFYSMLKGKGKTSTRYLGILKEIRSVDGLTSIANKLEEDLVKNSKEARGAAQDWISIDKELTEYIRLKEDRKCKFKLSCISDEDGLQTLNNRNLANLRKKRIELQAAKKYVQALTKTTYRRETGKTFKLSWIPNEK